MTKQDVSIKPSGLDLLRAPFPASQISKLPKPTRQQTDDVKNDFKSGIRCAECGQWHHPKVQHVDYVGHAALTARLLDADPLWNWEPVAFDERGNPAVDPNGGMWIKLTVCGHTRLGYGHPDGKKGGDAIKETIGDALRNAAMRFGAALDLWHKGDLHSDDSGEGKGGNSTPESPKDPAREAIENAASSLANADSLDRLKAIWLGLPKPVQADATVILAKDNRKAALETTPKPAADLGDDTIPY